MACQSQTWNPTSLNECKNPTVFPGSLLGINKTIHNASYMREIFIPQSSCMIQLMHDNGALSFTMSTDILGIGITSERLQVRTFPMLSLYCTQ